MKKSIEKIAILVAIVLLPLWGCAQGAQKSPPDKVTKAVGNTTITIDYHQPSVNGRTIWGELVPYGKVWRTGANQATTFEVSDDVKIGDKTLKAGKYSMFTIPDQNEWTIIFNEQTGQWGTQYDEKKDVLRIKAKPEQASQMQEQMTFDISNDGIVSLMWENLKVDFQVTPAESASSEM